MDRICGFSIMDRTSIHYAPQSADPIHPEGIVGFLYNLPFRGAGPVSPRAVGVTGVSRTPPPTPASRHHC
ncbi:unnamed protein product [Staurois parvus]|uniref:Uncharacterized protein n=1 Tax=Staurois parvus TaxID=386267 RepID=A0ABN9HNX6_9NEOB|nr:unnamed protein product [Staurois parvus]